MERLTIIISGQNLEKYFAVFFHPKHNVQKTSMTFEQVYNLFYAHKFGPYAHRKLSKAAQYACKSAWGKLETIYNRTLDEVSIDELDAIVKIIANQGYSKSTVTRVVTLLRQIYRYAGDRAYCKSQHGLHVGMPEMKEEEHHPTFSDVELKILWEAYRKSSDPVIVNISRMILIMCYSGFRIREYENMTVETEENILYFRGGLKTKAGKGRRVPVHSRILPLLKEIMVNGHPIFLCGKKHGQFRKDMKKILCELKIDGPHEECKQEAFKTESIENINSIQVCHTPHSTRHTFSRLCESYSVNESDRKRMLGHSLRGDITNGVYGHRSIAELKEQIEKIKCP